MKRRWWILALASLGALVLLAGMRLRPEPLPHPRFIADTPLKAVEDRSNAVVEGPFAEVYHLPRPYAEVGAEAERELAAEGWTRVPSARPPTDLRAEWSRRNAQGHLEFIAIRDKAQFEAKAKVGDGKPGVILLISREEAQRSTLNRILRTGPGFLFQPSER